MLQISGFFGGDLWLWLALTKISIVTSNSDIKFTGKFKIYVTRSSELDRPLIQNDGKLTSTGK